MSADALIRSQDFERDAVWPFYANVLAAGEVRA
jgi:hypothetical protein